MGGGAGPRPRDLYAVDGPAHVIDRSEDSYVGSWTQVHSDSLLTAWGVRKKKRAVKFEDEVPTVMPREVNSVNACEGTWEKIDITVDSGAVDTVAPPSVASHVPIESTWASQEGYCYRAANGQLLPNLGERKIKGVTQEGCAVGLTFQVAEVTKVLGSVSKFCEAGNRVVFDDSDPEGS